MAGFLEAIPSAASTPLAFAAYVVCTILFLLAGVRLRQTSRLADEIKNIPEEDRRRALEIAADTKLPDTISAAEWLRLKRMQMAFMLAGSALIALFAVAAIALLSGSQADPERQKPRSWKEFVAEPAEDAMGFVVAYPSDWHVVQDEMTGFAGARPAAAGTPNQRARELSWDLSGLTVRGIVQHAGQSPAGAATSDAIFDTKAVLAFARSIEDSVGDADEPRAAILSERKIDVRIYSDTSKTPAGYRSDDAVIVESETNGIRQIALYYAADPGRSNSEQIWLFKLACSAPSDAFAAFRPICDEALTRLRLIVPAAMGE